MTQPENTTERDPLIHMLGMMSDGQSDYITNMESAGQRQLVHSDVLPIECRDDDALIALGFAFGDPTDDLFRKATLPEGWSKKGSDHAMHSSIVDERGIERVGIFYKAAFYDRRADMHLVNVGWSLATAFIYGDGTDTTPWDVLTDDERESFIAGLDNYLEQNDAHPDIYNREGRADRARARRDELISTA